MNTGDKIRELTAQLLRAENGAVAETVAAQLQIEVDEHVQTLKRETPEVILIPAVSSAA